MSITFAQMKDQYQRKGTFYVSDFQKNSSKALINKQSSITTIHNAE